MWASPRSGCMSLHQTEDRGTRLGQLSPALKPVLPHLPCSVSMSGTAPAATKLEPFGAAVSCRRLESAVRARIRRRWPYPPYSPVVTPWRWKVLQLGSVHDPGDCGPEGHSGARASTSTCRTAWNLLGVIIGCSEAVVKHLAENGSASGQAGGGAEGRAPRRGTFPRQLLAFSRRQVQPDQEPMSHEGHARVIPAARPGRGFT